MRFRENLVSYTIIAVSIVASVINYFVVRNTEISSLVGIQQQFYLFSTMAQVIGGLFGLTLTAYVFFVNSFKTSIGKNDSYYEASAFLLKKYFNTMITVTIISICSVIFCIAGIYLVNGLKVIERFIIHEAIILTIVGVISIAILGIMFLDPKKLDKETKRLKQSVEKYYEVGAGDTKADLREFLKTYNLLEKVIIDLANCLVENNNQFYKDYQPRIIQAMKVLNLNEIMNRALSREIDELRVYRNSLVHGTDFLVSERILSRLIKIYNAIDNVYEMRNNRGTEEWNNSIKELYSIAR